jgi:hypothetical protein
VSNSVKLSAGTVVGGIVCSLLSRKDQIENYYIVVGKLRIGGNKSI